MQHHLLKIIHQCNKQLPYHTKNIQHHHSGQGQNNWRSKNRSQRQGNQHRQNYSGQNYNGQSGQQNQRREQSRCNDYFNGAPKNATPGIRETGIAVPNTSGMGNNYKNNPSRPSLN